IRARRSSPRPRLRALAERLGILSEYVDMGGVRRRTSDAAREELLAVMGFEAPTEDAAWGWLAELDHEERESVLSPVRVVERDWGVGDLSTLARVVEWAGQRGAAFVGVNPLHALCNRGVDISPYSPVSRLFRNPIYIDVECVPELAHSEPARALLASHAVREALRELRATKQVDYDRAIELKERVLVELHRTFRDRRHSGTQPARD